MYKILLTGANGFIGSYFKERYGNKYHIKSFSFLQDDFNELNMEGVDAVIHLSALVHQMGGASVEEYERVNVMQTHLLAQKAKNSGVKYFIFMSSIKVCGEESKQSYCSTTHCHPVDAYGKSKLQAESLLHELEDETFKVAIIRPPIVYGYGVKANIQNLVTLVQKVSVLPFGDIDNKRSMIYVGNLCYIVETLLQKQQGGVFFVSDEKTLSTKEFIEVIAKVLDKDISLLRVPFFAKLLKLLKPSFYKRLYESLEIDNRESMQNIFHSSTAILPYSVEEGISYMIKGER